MQLPCLPAATSFGPRRCPAAPSCQQEGGRAAGQEADEVALEQLAAGEQKGPPEAAQGPLNGMSCEMNYEVKYQMIYIRSWNKQGPRTLVWRQRRRSRSQLLQIHVVPGGRRRRRRRRGALCSGAVAAREVRVWHAWQAAAGLFTAPTPACDTGAGRTLPSPYSSEAGLSPLHQASKQAICQSGREKEGRRGEEGSRKGCVGRAPAGRGGRSERSSLLSK